MGRSFTVGFFDQNRTITPSPNVRFTDGVMGGINGSARKNYLNGFQ